MSEDGDGDTSIRIKIETWRRLKDRKTMPDDSFDSVINELLDIAEEAEEGNPSKVPASAD
ncbi:hypothetical protein Hbl1158_02780 [Halobaculum sp. CBA1158]|uniref:hypothetical protein n=1 Tax=Halobaculum sp. CBA1158 TaxID=2904243 RepID=UPI001F1BFCD7|nr:hypothetical protein [Halobaculum sp. CBA1158]UIP00312.1 hypothetical protein Hbl1158_02780 [Halobaculum sp. CBA1158]